MCRVLKIARAGYYAWLHEPESGRTIEDKRLLQLIRSSYDASYGIYGYRRITLDLKELGEGCCSGLIPRSGIVYTYRPVQIY